MSCAKDTRYRDVFGTLGKDVAGVVASAATEAQGVKLLLGRLHTWERFLSRFGPDRLSDGQQIGLFAELHFLTAEAIPIVPAASAAVTAWRGPYMEPTRLRFRAVAGGGQGQFSKVTELLSGVEPRPTGTRVPAGIERSLLVLSRVTIGSDGRYGSTLPEMVAKARAALAASDPAGSSDLDTSLICWRSATLTSMRRGMIGFSGSARFGGSMSVRPSHN